MFKKSLIKIHILGGLLLSVTVFAQPVYNYINNNGILEEVKTDTVGNHSMQSLYKLKLDAENRVANAENQVLVEKANLAHIEEMIQWGLANGIN